MKLEPKKLTHSILIPTLGRTEEVYSLLGQIQDQSVHPEFVIVIDQNETAIPNLNQYLQNTGIQLRHVHTPHEKGLQLALNNGIKNCSTDLLTVIDDDVRLYPGFIQSVQKRFHEDLTLSYVAGRVHQPSGDLPPDQIQKVGQYNPWTGSLYANFSFDQPKTCVLMPGGNMSWRLSVLKAIGGFDTLYDGNSYFGESDACLRANRSGFKGFFDPQIRLDHLQAPRGGCRVPDKSEFVFNIVKNGLLLNCRFSPRWWWLVHITKWILYIAAVSLKNRSIQVFMKGIQGFQIGLKRILNLALPSASPGE